MTDKKEQELKEEDFEEFDEEAIKNLLKKYSKDPKKLKETPLKSIRVFGNKIVKTQIRCEGIEKGVNILKGVEVKCSECGKKSTIYNPYIRNAIDFCGCTTIGSRGGEKNIRLERKNINDTGFWLEVSDPLDEGGSQNTYSIFVGLDVIENENFSLTDFENSLLSDVFKIEGILRIKQGKERNISDWFIDVTSFKVLKDTAEYDLKIIKSLNGQTRDNKFFENYYCPKVFGRQLSKKIHALTLCQPHEITLPNKDKIMSSTTNIEVGDQGNSKTVLCRDGYCKYSNSPLYSAGNTTKAGLIMGAQKGKTGRFVAVIGVIPRNHKGGVVIDEYGKLEQEDIAELRGIESEGILQSNKIGMSIKRACYVNQIQIGNLKNDVAYYNTKHKASYDLAVNKSDKQGKFSGADRRRKAHVVVIDNNDLDTQEISKKLLIKQETKDFDDYQFWNNLNKFAWSREPDQFIWEENIEEYILKAVNKLNTLFGKWELEYGALGKGASIVFTKQLPAVAILHGSINSELVEIKKEHVNWLFDLYMEEFKDLGLYEELDHELFLESHAKKIIGKCSNTIKEQLRLLIRHGSLSAVERSGEVSRKTLQRYFSIPIEYQLEEDPTTCYYILSEGSVLKKQISQNEETKSIWENDDLLQPLYKKDGSTTKFGEIIIKQLKQQETENEAH